MISFEGIDGAGKSTHLVHAREVLESHGLEVEVTREPGGCPLSENLRSLLLNHPMTVNTEILLAFAARVEHLNTRIRPALARGCWVLTDRFTDATMAYQGWGRGGDRALIRHLEHGVLDGVKPARTYWFALDPHTAAQRRSKRQGDQDRFEVQDDGFFARVHAGYQARCEEEPERVLRLDARRTVEELAAQLGQDLSQLVRSWRLGQRLSPSGASDPGQAPGAGVPGA